MHVMSNDPRMEAGGPVSIGSPFLGEEPRRLFAFHSKQSSFAGLACSIRLFVMVSSDSYAVGDSFWFLRGRPRLRLPFFGLRAARFGPLDLVRGVFGDSTVHPALRKKSI